MKKLFALVLAVLMTLALFGCNSNQPQSAEPSAPPESSVATEAPPVSEEQQSSEAPAVVEENTPASSDEQITIIYQTWKGAGREADYSKVPGLENVTVEILNLAYEASDSKMRVDLASNSSSVDVYAGYGNYTFDAVSDYMADIEPYIIADLGPAWKSYFPQPYIDEITDANGVVKAIACGFIDDAVWFYDADIFAKYGVSPPKTYDDLVALCAAMKGQGFVPAMIGGSEGWILMSFALTIATQTAPGEIYAAANFEQSWNTPGMIETFRIFQDTFKTIWQDGALTASHYGDSWEMFLAGNTSMFLGSMAAGGVCNDEKYADRNIRAFLFPDVNGDGQPSLSIAGTDEILFVNKNSAHIDEAAKVALYWGYGDGYKKVLNGGGSYGYFQAGMPDTTDWTPATIALVENLMEFYDVMRYSTTLKRNDTSQVFTDALMQLAANAVTPERAVEQLDQDCAALLD